MKKAVIGVLACALAAALGACAWMGVGVHRAPRLESAAIVRVEAPPDWAAGNISLGYMRWLAKATEGNPGALLARDGDVLWLAPEKTAQQEKLAFVVPWGTRDGETLSLRVDGPCLVLGNQIVSLYLEKHGAGWDWIGSASEKQLTSLRSLVVDEPFSDEQLTALEKIARVNPHVGLSLHDGTLLKDISSFDPHWLIVKEEISQEDLDALVQRKAIQTLILSAKDSSLNLQLLAALPNLRHLTLIRDSDSGKTALPLLPRLESLTLFGGALKDLTALRPLVGLRELNFTLSEMDSLNGIEALIRLRELELCGAEDKQTLNCARLDGLKGLHWVAFGPGIAQEQIARVIQTHPDLQVVELLNCEGITNTVPFASLRDLNALIFLPKGYEGTLDPIRQMKGLRLLVLPDEILKKKPAEVAKLRDALPGCLIVEGAPFCLGAGRILLLVPLAVLGWACIARHRSRAA
jgi:hypothetical protein